MIHFTKPLFAALSGVDPLVFMVPIVVGLGVSFVAALYEVEQIRARRRQAKCMSLEAQAVSRRHPPDHRN